MSASDYLHCEVCFDMQSRGVLVDRGGYKMAYAPDAEIPDGTLILCAAHASVARAAPDLLAVVEKFVRLRGEVPSHELHAWFDEVDAALHKAKAKP